MAGDWRGTYVGGGEATVSSFITLIILLAGVLGGLIIVIIVILICKYCVKGKKPSRRSLRDGSSSGVGEGGRAVRLLQRYETINSDMLSEPSTASLDGIPLSPRKPHDPRGRVRREDTEEINERTQLRSSYDKDLQAEEGSMTVLDEMEAGASARRSASRHGEDRRMGEGLEEDRSPSLGSLGSEDRGATASVHRLTEEDFHRLKLARLTSLLPSQVVVEGEGSPPPTGSPLTPSSSRPTPSLGAAAMHAAFRYSLDERLRILQQEAERSFPPLHLGTLRRSPRARRRGSSPEARLRPDAFPEELEGAAAAAASISVMHESPSPPSLLHGSPRDLTEQWRRRRRGRRSRGGTPSASPSPPGEPVYRQINVEVHRDQGKEEPLMVPSGSQEPVTTEQPHVPTTTTTTTTTAITTTTTTIQETGPSSPPPPSSLPARSSPTSQDSSAHHYHHLHQQQQQLETQQQQEQLHRSSICKDHRTEPTADGGGSSEAAAESAAPPATLPLTLQQQQEEQDLLQSMPRHVQRAQAYQKRISHSLELAGAGARRRAYPSTRRVKSYEDVADDHDVLQITEFSRGPFYNTDYDVISEHVSPTSSKVRYNDTGSLEELAEDTGAEEEGATCLALEALLPPDTPGDDEDEDLLSEDVICPQNRELWMLRATLEEEEECSDTVRMEDGATSPEDSPQQEHVPFLPAPPAADDISQQPDTADQPTTEPAEAEAEAETEAAESPPDADVSTEDGGPHSLPSPPLPPPSAVCGVDEGNGCCSNGAVEVPATAAAQQLLHPNYEKRRQTYKNGRHGRSPGGSEESPAHGRAQASANNSLDSVDTDGEVSDTSRQEVTSTSFESTTDNTDSTTESQHSRLRQMKTDSGYKSLETQQSGVRDPGDILEMVDLPGEYIVEAREPEEMVADAEEGRAGGNGHASRGVGGHGAGGHGAGGGSREGEPQAGSGVVVYQVAGGRRNSNAVHFERRAGRTASKKRREYSRERQVIHVYESVLEPEETAAAASGLGGSLDSAEGSRVGLHPQSLSFQQQQQHSGQPPASKRSVFTRFFSQARDPQDKYMVRDYSIDEKTNQIFNEFLRQEPPSESCPGRGEGGARLGLRRSPRSQHRSRMQRKHTDPLYRLDDRRRDRLAPEVRSSSMGSDSSAGSVRRLSPQDSIEEEFEEEEGEEEEGDGKGPELPTMLEVGSGGGGGGEGTESSSTLAVFPASKGIVPDIAAVPEIAAGPDVAAIPDITAVTDRAAIPDIPLIKLPEEEAQDVW
ncbi:uncharacterized protein LOC143294638 [Babylonia areolata]|uniref:uncharacterized protein LOC143294638 n=1 Tax=Babylonia areolata TaxID=304850 RepID=UPI003FD24F56